jgi:type IV secretory pathway VirB2 component (pilin)
MNNSKTINAAVCIKENQQLMLLSLFTVALHLFLSDPANAAWSFTATGVATVLCNAAYIVVFDIGRGLASLAIIAIGVSALLGKASWGQAMSIGVGIGVVFGSLNLATYLTNGLIGFLGMGLPDMPCVAGGALR